MSIRAVDDPVPPNRFRRPAQDGEWLAGLHVPQVKAAMITGGSQLLAVRAIGDFGYFVLLAVQGSRFGASRYIPKPDELDAIIPGRDLFIGRAYGQLLELARRPARAEYGEGTIELTMEVAPLPAVAVLLRGVVEGTPHGDEIVEFQGRGGGPNVRPVPLPAFLFAGSRFLLQGRIAFLDQLSEATGG